MPSRTSENTGGQVMQKTMTITVPESWTDVITEAAFRQQLQSFFERNQPCSVCSGEGHYQPGNHLSDQEEIYCEKCGGKGWENPLLG
jgi:DnaJ-class molecular chaperone